MAEAKLRRMRIKELEAQVRELQARPPSNTSAFQPCILQNEKVGVTLMLLEDTETMWHPLKHGGQPKGDFLDLGYDMDGNLVGIRIWACVKNSKVFKKE
jgi:hypothetical protein